MSGAAAVQTTFWAEPPPRWPVARRVHCACGCGRWFYWERSFNRAPKYATPECHRRERNRRRRVAVRQQWARARDLATGRFVKAEG